MTHPPSIPHRPPSAPLQGVGLGLRHRHLLEVKATKPRVPWFEVHTENFLGGGAATALLEAIRRDYPISAHCVGLSLGSAPDAAHREKIQSFIARFQPALVSDHLSWGSAAMMHMPDLLPVPYTEEALSVIVENILRVQEAFGMTILIENPSSYLAFTSSDIPEQEFIVSVAKRSGCGILLDLNNVVVSCQNHGWDASAYLAAIPTDLVGEIHLAGYGTTRIGAREVLIDTHGARVQDPVWELFETVTERFHNVPVLIEWDTEVPALSVLMEEREKAVKLRERVSA